MANKDNIPSDQGNRKKTYKSRNYAAKKIASLKRDLANKLQVLLCKRYGFHQVPEPCRGDGWNWATKVMKQVVGISNESKTHYMLIWIKSTQDEIDALEGGRLGGGGLRLGEVVVRGRGESASSDEPINYDYDVVEPIENQCVDGGAAGPSGYKPPGNLPNLPSNDSETESHFSFNDDVFATMQNHQLYSEGFDSQDPARFFP